MGICIERVGKISFRVKSLIFSLEHSIRWDSRMQVRSTFGGVIKWGSMVVRITKYENNMRITRINSFRIFPRKSRRKLYLRLFLSLIFRRIVGLRLSLQDRSIVSRLRISDWCTRGEEIMRGNLELANCKCQLKRRRWCLACKGIS